MTKSNNIQIEDILNNIYNLILNPETTEEERNLLVTFKNEIEVGKKDNGELLAELRRAIQVLAVDNLSKGISLSQNTYFHTFRNRFYAFLKALSRLFRK